MSIILIFIALSLLPDSAPAYLAASTYLTASAAHTASYKFHPAPAAPDAFPAL